MVAHGIKMQGTMFEQFPSLGKRCVWGRRGTREEEWAGGYAAYQHMFIYMYTHTHTHTHTHSLEQ